MLKRVDPGEGLTKGFEEKNNKNKINGFPSEFTVPGVFPASRRKVWGCHGGSKQHWFCVPRLTPPAADGFFGVGHVPQSCLRREGFSITAWRIGGWEKIVGSQNGVDDLTA